MNRIFVLFKKRIDQVRVACKKSIHCTRVKIGHVGVFLIDSGIHLSLGILALTVLIALVWSFQFPDKYHDYQVEFVGLIFDVLFILVLLSVFEHSRRRSQDIKRQQETIEDYKRWSSDEARIRLAGAIRRLNRLGIFNIDLTGARLTYFRFAENGISSISGSVFYDGTWGEPLKHAEVLVSHVKFDWVRCRNVQFSPFNPLQGLVYKASEFARFIDCSFIHCDLSDSSFNGAYLAWTSSPPHSLYEDVGEDDDGRSLQAQTAYGPFHEADLNGASFVNTLFANADFRGARNIECADFTGAQGLETCIFDSEALENKKLHDANVRVG